MRCEEINLDNLPPRDREVLVRFANELVETAKKVGESLLPGAYVRLRDYELEFLPPDIRKYIEYGCDVDGGNYCSYWVPVVYKNSRGEVQYYIATWSSCELGERYVYIVEEDGELVDIALTPDDWVYDRDFAEEIVEKSVYNAFHPDYEIHGPLTEEELFCEAVTSYNDWLDERAYLEKYREEMY